MPASHLTDLLDGPAFKLAYAVPLLLVSLILTFAGTFLTLDRTRSFKPHYETISTPKRKWSWRLEGGVGGICIGWSFGVYLSSLLSILIPSTTNSSPLTSSSFIAVWIISAAAITLVSSRWKLVALPLATIGGPALFILAVGIIIHPALLTRQVLLAICVITMLLLMGCCHIFPRLHPYIHLVLRFCTSAIGAFGVIQSSATLASVPEVANAFERWWVVEDEAWGSSKEKGLSAGFCLFLVAGIASDWLLNRFVGQCPDEEWDEYLASFTRNMPNQQGRAGMFRPFESSGPLGWLFPKRPSSDPEKDDILFEPGSPAISKDREAFEGNDSRVWTPPPPAYLRKSSSSPRIPASSGRKRERIKFDPTQPPEYSSESEDEATSPIRPLYSKTSSQATLVGRERPKASKGFSFTESESGRLKKPKKPWVDNRSHPEYSDHEEDVYELPAKEAADGKWEPGFIRKASLRSSSGATTSSSSTKVNSNPIPSAGALSVPSLSNPVPATPSLIKAIERVQKAQNLAVSESGASSPRSETAPKPMEIHMPKPSRHSSGLPRVSEYGDDPNRWTDFWEDVKKTSDDVTTPTTMNATKSP